MSENHNHNEIAKIGSDSHGSHAEARHALSDEFVKNGASKGNTMASDAEKQAENILSTLRTNLDFSMAQDARLGLHTKDPMQQADIWQNTPDKYLQVHKNDVLVDPAYKKVVLEDLKEMSGQYGLTLNFTDIWGKGDFYAQGRPADKN